jgi:hypothetical protein
MMENEHLHLFIDEEVFILNENLARSSEKKEIHPKTETNKEIEKPKIKFTFIHNSDSKEELGLLNKIIEACKISPADFYIGTDDSSIDFLKAIYFKESNNECYIVKSGGSRSFIYSKPLSVLQSSKDDKAKLWAALKAFTS